MIDIKWAYRCSNDSPRLIETYPKPKHSEGKEQRKVAHNPTKEHMFGVVATLLQKVWLKTKIKVQTSNPTGTYNIGVKRRFLRICDKYHMGGSRISGKGVHMYKGLGVHFVDFISFN